MTSLFIPRRASIADGHLHFLCDGGFLAALRDGCFALRIPEEFNLGPAVKLAREFYLELGPKKPSLDVSYRGFRQKADIYFDRDHFQTEHILIDTPRRKVEFPPAVNVVCEQMYELARIVLREILSSIGVARPLWNRVTDRCVERGGVQWFAVNHYRPERAQVGAPAHKDTG